MTVSLDKATGLEISNPDTMFDPTPLAFSHLAILPPGARTVFVAGQGGGSPKGDFAEQVESALSSIGTAMAAAGGAMSGVAKFTIYVVDHDEDKHEVIIDRVKAAVGERLAPTCTIVPLTQLGTDPDMLVEIEAVGLLPARHRHDCRSRKESACSGGSGQFPRRAD